MTLTDEQEKSYKRLILLGQPQNANSDGSALCAPLPEQEAWIAAIEHAGAIQINSFRPLELINVAALRLSTLQYSETRLREGLRELAERHDGTAAELDAIFGKPWAKPLHEVTAIELKRDLLKMFAGEIRALLSLEGDKTT